MSGRIRLPVLSSAKASSRQSLQDRFQRQVRYLRVSLTDRCNYRCTYCMPAEGVELMPRGDILQFEEIERLVRVFVGMGVRRVRLTGGEPTVRRDLVSLVARLAAIDGLEQVVMTSNGHLLPQMAAPLARAGLAEVNVSLDTLDPERFRQLTRRGDLGRVLAGIDAALAAGLRVKLNAVALAGVSERELVGVCTYAWARGVLPRFIEHMPMSGGELYAASAHLPAAEIRRLVSEELGAPLEPIAADGPVGPARYWRLAGPGPERRLGIISAMSEHFCATCNRVRLSATGQLHTCLAHDDASDLRAPLRAGADDDTLRARIVSALEGKREGHEFQLAGTGAPGKHMVSIGG